MLDHHIQKKIVGKLVSQPSARFSELKPRGTDSNVFSYHLKTLMKQKLVQRLPDGGYALTSTGTFASVHLSHNPIEVLELAHSIVFIVIHKNYQSWLLKKLSKYPFRDSWGFMAIEPNARTPITSLVQGGPCKDLVAPAIQIAGSGYISVTSQNSIESYRHFTLVEVNLNKDDIYSLKNNQSWFSTSDVAGLKTVPGTNNLISELVKSRNRHFFVDLTFTIQN